MNILPEGQDFLHGLINMQGKIIPVINIRKHFYLPVREMDINDRIIISHASEITVAFVVDMVDFRGIWTFVFNLADVWINIGVALILLAELIVSKKKKENS